jgi:protein SMG6
LQLVSGYTILVLDTNILLSSLSMVTSLVESLRWTVVVPLPAIMELDGLAMNVNALGDAAKAAIAFMASLVSTTGQVTRAGWRRG